MKLPLYLALRHLKSTQKGSFTRMAGILAMAGLAVGIAALLITLFIMEGFEQTLSSKIADFDGHIRIRHFLHHPIERKIPVIDSLLSAFPKSVNYTSFIQSPALLRKGRQAEGVLVEGIDPKGTEFLSNIIVEGTMNLEFGSVIFGQRLAQKMGLKIGDKIVLFDLESMASTSTNRRLKSFNIAALFHSGLLEYDESLVFLRLEDAQTLFGFGTKVTGHVIRLPGIDQVETLSAALELELPYPFMVMTWKEKNRALFKWMNVQCWPILIIFGLIALVGIVNVVSALSMIVVEKIHQIGILTSLGLSTRDLQRMFLYKGFIIGLLGSFLGTVLALILAGVQIHFKILSIPEDVYFMDHVPMIMKAGPVLIVFIIGVFGSMLSSLWPTWRAGKIRPSDALRYE